MGCAAYQPGAFTAPGQGFGGQRRTVGCFDLAVELTHDAATTDPVIAYTVGNRCDQAQWLDLGAVQLVARTEGGREVNLVPYDPAQKLGPALLEARSVAREAIAYQTGAGQAHDGGLVSLCVGLGRLGPGGRSPDRVAVCFALPPTAPPPAPGGEILAWSGP